MGLAPSLAELAASWVSAAVWKPETVLECWIWDGMRESFGVSLGGWLVVGDVGWSSLASSPKSSKSSSGESGIKDLVY